MTEKLQITSTAEEKKFSGLNIDFSNLNMMTDTQKPSKVEYIRGDMNGLNAGHKAGSFSGFSIQTDGKIIGAYDNDVTLVLGQIVLATFPNPSGLESVGDSLYKETPSSGEFDGIGLDPSELDGLVPGTLEMSNVDLSSEFTTMITTQRGFQANSRIITVSDSLLEELISLKR